MVLYRVAQRSCRCESQKTPLSSFFGPTVTTTPQPFYGPFPGPLERLEAVQRWAIKIIFCYSSATSYLTTLELAGILSLQTRRMDLSKRLFRNICKPDNCLHHLLPPPRDIAVTSRLRKPTVYPRPSLRTKRYCSALSYALLNFQ